MNHAMHAFLDLQNEKNIRYFPSANGTKSCNIYAKHLQQHIPRVCILRINFQFVHLYQIVDSIPL